MKGLRRRLRSTAFLAVPSLAKARATRNSTTISDTNIVDTTDSSVHPKNRPTSVDEDVPRSLRSRLPRATTREYASRLVDEVAEVILLADSENLTFLPLADRLLVRVSILYDQGIILFKPKSLPYLGCTMCHCGTPAFPEARVCMLFFSFFQAQALEALDIAAVHHQSADSGGSLVSSYFRVTNMLQNQSDAHGSESHLSDQNAFLKERLGLAPTTSDISLGNIYVNSTLRLLLLRAHVSLVNDYARQHWLCLQNQLRDFEVSFVDKLSFLDESSPVWKMLSNEAQTCWQYLSGRNVKPFSFVKPLCCPIASKSTTKSTRHRRVLEQIPRRRCGQEN